MSILHKQCICQICNCGRHRCPHQPLKPRSVCHLTEYQTTYTGNRVQPRASCKPKERPVGNSFGVEGISTQQHDYPVHPLYPRRVKSAEAYRRPSGEVEEQSEYMQHYPSHGAGHAAQTLYPKHRRRTTAPLESVTEHSKSFVAWPLERRKTAAPPTTRIASSVPMDLETTTGQTYQHRKVQPRESMKPKEPERESLPMHSETTHGADFGPKDLPDRGPQRGKDQYRASKHPLENTSTSMDAFRKHSGDQRAKSCKPRPEAAAERPPLDTNTTHSTAFHAWRANPPAPKPARRYVAPKGEMESRTTHQLVYHEHGQREPERARRPASRLRTRSEPLLTETTHAANYKQWHVKPERPYHPSARVPPAEFQGTTEFQESFVGRQTTPVTSFKPAPKMHSQGEFEFSTGYQQDFQQKVVPPCPAVGLQLRPNSASQARDLSGTLRFSHATQSGHHFFTPATGNTQL